MDQNGVTHAHMPGACFTMNWTSLSRRGYTRTYTVRATSLSLQRKQLFRFQENKSDLEQEMMLFVRTQTKDQRNVSFVFFLFGFLSQTFEKLHVSVFPCFLKMLTQAMGLTECESDIAFTCYLSMVVPAAAIILACSQVCSSCSSC